MKLSRPGLSVALRQQREEPIKVSLLINSIFYFLENVFIMTVEEGFRLIVIHQGYLLTDEIYKTLKGAKIAFLKFWNYKAWEEGVRPQWSHLYPPETKWLDKKFQNHEQLVNRKAS